LYQLLSTSFGLYAVGNLELPPGKHNTHHSEFIIKITQSLKYGQHIHHIIWATNKLVMIIPHASDGY
jgi:hypothetical protein